jgi:hypothetical protein
MNKIMLFFVSSMSLFVERRLAVEEQIAERIILLEEQILNTEVAESRH